MKGGISLRQKIRICVLFSVLCTIILLFVSALSEQSGENLIDNSDFMSVDMDGLPEGWYTDAYILDPGYTVFSLKNGGKDHPLYVEVNNIGNNDARFAQTVPVDPDSLYCLSGYIRAEQIEGGHGANLSVEGVYAFSEELFDTGGEWQYITYYGETGPEQDYLTVFARVGGYSGESRGKADFAGISLVRVDEVPADVVADLWYRENAAAADEEEMTDETGKAFFPYLIILSVLYAVFAVLLLFLTGKISRPFSRKKTLLCAAAVLALSLVLRLLICYHTDGYMVDVNCFLSWGQTMAAVGPVQFYQATSFCDYPPLYTYILGFNSAIAGLLNANPGQTRIIFRLIPTICDLAACMLIYQRLIRRNGTEANKCLMFLAFLVFNPALILNSAAWGQMDSVLCLILLLVIMFAVDDKWMAALPLYVAGVLIKPQALMLGPLGLTFIVRTVLHKPEKRRTILFSTIISLITAAAVLIPFSIKQNWDWCIQLYARTLGSYPYATVNTANLYYLAGGNWAAVGKTAHIAAPILLSAFCLVYGALWYMKMKDRRFRLIETIVSFLFAAVFLVLCVLRGSWGWVGGCAMAFAFVIVMSLALRSDNPMLLPYLGSLLYILLYVFGVKMHERYIFPALLLLAFSWTSFRDRRMIAVFILFTSTLFINEGIVLDNSIRLGSSLGHLNQDTVWLADLLSILNIIGALYAVHLSLDLFAGKGGNTILSRFMPEPGKRKETALREWRPDRSLHWSRKDTIILLTITAAYSCVSLLTLGSLKAPQTAWISSSSEESVVFDLGEQKDNFEILYFAQVSRNDFTFSVSDDGINWFEETWAQMDQGQCWKWKYVTRSAYNGGEQRIYYNSDPDNIIRFNGRYIRLNACQLGLTLNEVLFRDEKGNILPVSISRRSGEEPDSELYSDPVSLIDEQDTLEKLPSFPGGAEPAESVAQPSWWNSTYFDEIYHARTAFEFLRGTVPYETSHPPLGKILMSCFVAVFGMTPFGWRFAGALAGILMLPAMYLLAKQLTKKTGLSVLSCLLITFDCMHLTQSQIATIDSFPVLFILFSYFFMLRFIQTDYLREKNGTALRPLFLSGLFMGCSIASKWIGIYAGAGLAFLFFCHCYRVNRIHTRPLIDSGQETSENLPVPVTGALHDRHEVFIRFFHLCLWCVLFFVIIPLIIYLLSYIPYMAYNSKRIHSLWDYIAEVWKAQVGMFNYHSTPNLGMDHPFYSPWWEWPIIGKPMYYAAEQYIPDSYSVHHSIFCFGNPVIWFGGLGAFAFLLVRCISERFRSVQESIQFYPVEQTSDFRHFFLFTGIAAQYLPWVLVPRGTYIYHYFASIPFLMLMIVMCFDGYGAKYKRIVRTAAVILVVLVAAAFVVLFPYASGIAVPAAWLDAGRNILRIWY